LNYTVLADSFFFVLLYEKVEGKGGGRRNWSRDSVISHECAQYNIREVVVLDVYKPDHVLYFCNVFEIYVGIRSFRFMGRDMSVYISGLQALKLLNAKHVTRRGKLAEKRSRAVFVLIRDHFMFVNVF